MCLNFPSWAFQFRRIFQTFDVSSLLFNICPFFRFEPFSTEVKFIWLNVVFQFWKNYLCFAFKCLNSMNSLRLWSINTIYLANNCKYQHFDGTHETYFQIYVIFMKINSQRFYTFIWVTTRNILSFLYLKNWIILFMSVLVYAAKT